MNQVDLRAMAFDTVSTAQPAVLVWSDGAAWDRFVQSGPGQHGGAPLGLARGRTKDVRSPDDRPRGGQRRPAGRGAAAGAHAQPGVRPAAAVPALPRLRRRLLGRRPDGADRTVRRGSRARFVTARTARAAPASGLPVPAAGRDAQGGHDARPDTRRGRGVAPAEVQPARAGPQGPAQRADQPDRRSRAGRPVLRRAGHQHARPGVTGAPALVLPEHGGVPRRRRPDPAGGARRAASSAPPCCSATGTAC